MSILKCNHVTTLHRILPRVPIALEKEPTPVNMIYLRTRVPWLHSISSHFSFSYLTHPFSTDILSGFVTDTVSPETTLPHLLFLVSPHVSAYTLISLLQKPFFSQAEFDALPLCIRKHSVQVLCLLSLSPTLIICSVRLGTVSNSATNNFILWTYLPYLGYGRS